MGRYSEAPPVDRRNRVWRWPDGSTRAIAETRGGQLDGTCKRWSPTGRLEAEVEYRGGVRHGRRREWDEAGAVLVDEQWREGEFVGPHVDPPPSPPMPEAERYDWGGRPPGRRKRR